MHYCGDVRDLLWKRRWRLVIAHPPCHWGARSNTGEKARRLLSGEHFSGAAFALLLYCAPADNLILEQPATELAELYRPPNQTLQTTDFGVPWHKTWCLWTRGAGVPTFESTEVVAASEPPPHRCGHQAPAMDRREIRQAANRNIIGWHVERVRDRFDERSSLLDPEVLCRHAGQHERA